MGSERAPETQQRSQPNPRLAYVYRFLLGGTCIVLLAYVHVTAQPAINPLYFSPGIVLVPALAACWLAMLIPAFRKQTAETTEIAETAAP